MKSNEVIKNFKCDKDNCKEISSVKTEDGGHLCIDHFLETVEE